MAFSSRFQQGLRERLHRGMEAFPFAELQVRLVAPKVLQHLLQLHRQQYPQGVPRIARRSPILCKAADDASQHGSERVEDQAF